MTAINWTEFFTLTSPWLVLIGGVFVILLGAAWPACRRSIAMPIMTLVVLIVSFLLSWNLWLHGEVGIQGMLSFDRMSFFGWMIVLIAAAFATMLSFDYLGERERSQPEYYALLLMSLIGMGVLIASADLIMIFLGIETMSIAVYALAGFFRTRPEGNEAALKYFLTGAFASAFIVMGIAFLFGMSGTTDLKLLGVAEASLLELGGRSFTLFGIAMLLIGFGFKVAAVPFHAWAPDVYEGSPTPITTFMATAVKAAAFIALIRVAQSLLVGTGDLWVNVVWVGAVATMCWGNIAAIAQDDIKRMLAYSSIAHAGYILVGFAALGANPQGITSGILLYLFSYILMTVGAFAVVIATQSRDREDAQINRLAGLGRRRPWLAGLLSLFLLSLTGFPPTIGFFAKYYLFLEVMRSGFTWLVVIALLNSAISAYYYLRPIMVMYFHSSREDASGPIATPSALVAVLVITALAVIVFGCFPGSLLAIVQHSTF